MFLPRSLLSFLHFNGLIISRCDCHTQATKDTQHQQGREAIRSLRENHEERRGGRNYKNSERQKERDIDAGKHAHKDPQYVVQKHPKITGPRRGRNAQSVCRYLHARFPVHASPYKHSVLAKERQQRPL